MKANEIEIGGTDRRRRGMSDKPPFEFGQVVYCVEANAHARFEVPCPVCYGKKKVTLILGNGESQDVSCECCDFGMRGPSGVVSEWGPWSRVVPAAVDSITQESSGWKVSCGHHSGEIFATEEEAEARRLALHADAEASAERMNEQNILRAIRKTTWTAGYCRRKIAHLRREMEWHEEKLCQAKAKAKAEKDERRITT